jgi:tRNA(Ile)-lysidine synthase
MTMRPRLTPAIADVRRAVRESLASLVPDASAAGAEPGSPEGAKSSTRGFVLDAQETARALKTKGRADGLAGGSSTDVPAAVAPVPTVLVALSGGADSLALAAATAFEAPRAGGDADLRTRGGAGLRAGAVIVDHGLQDGSADVAERAAAQARALGLDPVLVRRVEVGTDGGPEAAARDARYAALAAAASETGAIAVLLGHTLDDQAETVLLGLARGSGGASLSGMAPVMRARLRPPAVSAPARAGASDSAGRISGAGRSTAAGSSSGAGSSSAAASDAAGGASVTYLRPLLGIRRAQTVQFCVDSGLEPWHDPQNADLAFARVRVRESVLPMLERELGPGIAEALARTAELSREDSEALDHFAEEQAEELADHAEAGLSLSVKGLAHNPAALRQRIIRLAVASEFGVSLSRAQTLEVARLVTDWHGQGELHLPGIRVVRQGGLLVFSAAEGAGESRG